MPLAALHQLFMARFGRSFPRLVLVRIEEASGGNPFYALEIARTLAAIGLGRARRAIACRSRRRSVRSSRRGSAPCRRRRGRRCCWPPSRPSRPSTRFAVSAPTPQRPSIRRSTRVVIAMDRRSIRFTHPLLAHAVTGVAAPAELRRAHASLARAATSDDVRARHLGGATEGRHERVAAALEAAAGSRPGPRCDHRRRVPLRAGERSHAYGDLGDEALRRATLGRGMPLHRRLGDRPGGRHPRCGDRRGAAPGPARAEALSLRATHPLLPWPDARSRSGSASRRSPRSGDDPIRRARILGRAAFLVMQVDLERGNATGRGGHRGCSRRSTRATPVDPDLLANVLLLHASSELGLVRGYLDRRDRPRDRPDQRRRSHVGARRRRRHRLRARAPARRRRSGDRDDRATHPGQVRPGRGRPVQPRLAVGSPGLPRRLGRRRGGRPRRRSRATPARAPTSSRRGGCAASRWSRRMTAAPTTPGDWPAEGLELAIASGDLALEVYHRQILGFVALSIGDVREADAQLTLAASAARGQRHAPPGAVQARRRPPRGRPGGRRPRAGRSDRRRGSSTPAAWRRPRGPSRSAARGRGLLEAARRRSRRARSRRSSAPWPSTSACRCRSSARRTLLAIGQVHRRRKEKRLADERLREALGSLRSARRAALGRPGAAELARIGLRPRAPDDLTETERRVAELAATGLSSRADRGAGVPGAEDRRQRARTRLREARDPLAGRARRADGRRSRA